MSTETTPPASGTQAQPERVYITIPKAGPGQGYHAAKNEQQPLRDLAARVFVVLLCLSLPAATGLIFGMILAYDPNSTKVFLWIWIPLILFVEIIAILLCVGVAREGLGIAGSGFHQPGRGMFKRP